MSHRLILNGTLMNVHAFGDPVPSARFMGGREFGGVMDGIALPAVTSLQKQDLDKVLDENIMLLPAIEHHSGLTQGCQRIGPSLRPH